MRRISRFAMLGVLACVLAISGSTLAVAKGHHRHAHASAADVMKDVKDANKDSTAAQSDATTPDSSTEAQKEQTDAQSEAQAGQQEGDDAAQAIACKGLLTDNVQYDDQTGTCTAETGQDNSQNDTGGQDNNQND